MTEEKKSLASLEKYLKSYKSAKILVTAKGFKFSVIRCAFFKEQYIINLNVLYKSDKYFAFQKNYFDVKSHLNTKENTNDFKYNYFIPFIPFQQYSIFYHCAVDLSIGLCCVVDDKPANVFTVVNNKEFYGVVRKINQWHTS